MRFINQQSYQRRIDLENIQSCVTGYRTVLIIKIFGIKIHNLLLYLCKLLNKDL